MFKRFLKAVGRFLSRLFAYLGVIAFFVGLIYAFRFELLREIGDFLIDEDPLLRANAVVVLSGAPFERCSEGARLFKQDVAAYLVTTGESASSAAAILNKTPIPDAQLARIGLMNMGMDSSKIIPVSQGTSTYEEANLMLELARQKQFKRIIVVTSQQHTRRTKAVFRKRFKQSGIEVIVRGAPPLNYKTDKWWESEEGLIFVTNEYTKWLYYLLNGRI